ncbi:unnamed protein product [Amoebophrya sp. A120]|nr:unnamed protein product [Amoebophrya sp. A120]|eukprot:GSA120T00011710001.1
MNHYGPEFQRERGMSNASARQRMSSFSGHQNFRNVDHMHGGANQRPPSRGPSFAAPPASPLFGGSSNSRADPYVQQQAFAFNQQGGLGFGNQGNGNMQPQFGMHMPPEQAGPGMHFGRGMNAGLHHPPQHPGGSFAQQHQQALPGHMQFAHQQNPRAGPYDRQPMAPPGGPPRRVSGMFGKFKDAAVSGIKTLVGVIGGGLTGGNTISNDAVNPNQAQQPYSGGLAQMPQGNPSPRNDFYRVPGQSSGHFNFNPNARHMPRDQPPQGATMAQRQHRPDHPRGGRGPEQSQNGMMATPVLDDKEQQLRPQPQDSPQPLLRDHDMDQQNQQSRAQQQPFAVSASKQSAVGRAENFEPRVPMSEPRNFGAQAWDHQLRGGPHSPAPSAPDIHRFSGVQRQPIVSEPKTFGMNPDALEGFLSGANIYDDRRIEKQQKRSKLSVDHQSAQPKPAAASSEDDDNPALKQGLYKALVTRICHDYSGSKEHAFTLLEAYQGEEAMLYVKLCQKFNVQPSFYLQLQTGMVKDERFEEKEQFSTNTPNVAGSSNAARTQVRGRHGSYADTKLATSKSKEAAEQEDNTRSFSPQRHSPTARVASRPSSPKLPSPLRPPAATATSNVFGSVETPSFGAPAGTFTTGLENKTPVFGGAAPGGSAGSSSIFGGGAAAAAETSSAATSSIFGAPPVSSDKSPKAGAANTFGVAVGAEAGSSSTSLFGAKVEERNNASKSGAPKQAESENKPALDFSALLGGGGLEAPSFGNTSFAPLDPVPEEPDDCSNILKDMLQAKKVEQQAMKSKIEPVAEEEPEQEENVNKAEDEKSPEKKQDQEAVNKNSADSAGAAVVQKGSQTDFFKANIAAVYYKKNPKKIGNIDELLEKNKGSELLLYRKICKRYELPSERTGKDGKVEIIWYQNETIPDTDEFKEGDGEENADGASAPAGDKSSIPSTSKISAITPAGTSINFNTPANASIFGNPTPPNSAPAASTNSIFGSAPPGGGLFGGLGAAPAGGSLFGSAAPAGVQQPAGGSLFGSAAPAAAPAGGSPAGGSLFGSAAPAGGSASTSIFGNAATASTSTSIFGNPVKSSEQPAKASPTFGSAESKSAGGEAADSTKAPAAGAAEGEKKESTAGAPAETKPAPAGTGIFGGAAPPASSTGSIFGGGLLGGDIKGSSTSTTNIFGVVAPAAPAPPSSDANNKTTSIFGTTTTTTTATSTSSNIFGGSTPKAKPAENSIFGTLSGGIGADKDKITSIFGNADPKAEKLNQLEASAIKQDGERPTKRRSIFEASSTNQGIFAPKPETSIFGRAPSTNVLDESKPLFSASKKNARASSSKKTGRSSSQDRKTTTGSIFGGGAAAGNSLFGGPLSQDTGSFNDVFASTGTKSIFGNGKNAFGGATATERFGQNLDGDTPPLEVKETTTTNGASTPKAAPVAAPAGRKKRARDDAADEAEASGAAISSSNGIVPAGADFTGFLKIEKHSGSTAAATEEEVVLEAVVSSAEKPDELEQPSARPSDEQQSYQLLMHMDPKDFATFLASDKLR